MSHVGLEGAPASGDGSHREDAAGGRRGGHRSLAVGGGLISLNGSFRPISTSW